jgi:hypothetical protein
MHDIRSGDTSDLIAMRQGRITKAEYERRHGITDVRDARHEAWYASYRVEEIERRITSGQYAPAPEAPEPGELTQQEFDLLMALEVMGEDIEDLL